MSEIKTTIEGLRAIIADDVIAEVAMTFAPLQASTKDGYEEVKRAIGWCRTKRGEIEAKRKVLNEDALRWQRQVNAEAKRLTGLIEAIEDPLKVKKKSVDDEVERKRKELEEQHRRRINDRIEQYLKATGRQMLFAVAESMTDDFFWQALEVGREEKRKADAEAARIAKEEADCREALRVESERIAAERAELERQKEELRLAQERLKQAEREKVDESSQRMAAAEELLDGLRADQEAFETFGQRWTAAGAEAAIARCDTVLDVVVSDRWSLLQSLQPQIYEVFESLRKSSGVLSKLLSNGSTQDLYSKANAIDVLIGDLEAEIKSNVG
jgi:chromosome segregation ATPase